MVQRGINYKDEACLAEKDEQPIIDSAYVMMPFRQETSSDEKGIDAMACLELCMFADGSRHQEEVIVTGEWGRLEAYLPENKVYAYRRPDRKEWSDRTVPPPHTNESVHDCFRSQEREHAGESPEVAKGDFPGHSGYHYGSTAMEWYRLLEARDNSIQSHDWHPLVSLQDGLKAVEMGLVATEKASL